jgi:hypothetical protein
MDDSRDREPPITSRGEGKKGKDNDFQVVEGAKECRECKGRRETEASKFEDFESSTSSLWEVRKGPGGTPTRSRRDWK